MKTTKQTADTPEVTLACFKVEDTSGRKAWLQYLVVTPETTTHVDLTPALLSGWNVSRVTVQPLAKEWPDMTVSEIVRWKKHNSPYQILCDADETRRVLETLARRAQGGR